MERSAGAAHLGAAALILDLDAFLDGPLGKLAHPLSQNRITRPARAKNAIQMPVMRSASAISRSPTRASLSGNRIRLWPSQPFHGTGSLKPIQTKIKMTISARKSATVNLPGSGGSRICISQACHQGGPHVL